MCLTIPGRIESIQERGVGERVAVVEYGSQRRNANLIYLPEARVGDFVVVQAGFAVTRLDEGEAREALRYVEEMNASEMGSDPPPATEGS
jgi:hydrogenase expression/formation protein HypC